MEKNSNKDIIDEMAEEIAEELSKSKDFSQVQDIDGLENRIVRIEEQLNKLIHNHKIILQKIQNHDEEISKMYSELERALECVSRVTDKLKESEKIQ